MSASTAKPTKAQQERLERAIANGGRYMAYSIDSAINDRMRAKGWITDYVAGDGHLITDAGRRAAGRPDTLPCAERMTWAQLADLGTRAIGREVVVEVDGARVVHTVQSLAIVDATGYADATGYVAVYGRGNRLVHITIDPVDTITLCPVDRSDCEHGYTIRDSCPVCDDGGETARGAQRSAAFLAARDESASIAVGDTVRAGTFAAGGDTVVTSEWIVRTRPRSGHLGLMRIDSSTGRQVWSGAYVDDVRLVRKATATIDVGDVVDAIDHRDEVSYEWVVIGIIDRGATALEHDLLDLHRMVDDERGAAIARTTDEVTLVRKRLDGCCAHCGQPVTLVVLDETIVEHSHDNGAYSTLTCDPLLTGGSIRREASWALTPSANTTDRKAGTMPDLNPDAIPCTTKTDSTPPAAVEAFRVAVEALREPVAKLRGLATADADANERTAARVALFEVIRPTITTVFRLVIADALTSGKVVPATSDPVMLDGPDSAGHWGWWTYHTEATGIDVDEVLIEALRHGPLDARSPLPGILDDNNVDDPSEWEVEDDLSLCEDLDELLRDDTAAAFAEMVTELAAAVRGDDVPAKADGDAQLETLDVDVTRAVADMPVRAGDVDHILTEVAEREVDALDSQYAAGWRAAIDAVRTGLAEHIAAAAAARVLLDDADLDVEAEAAVTAEDAGRSTPAAPLLGAPSDAAARARAAAEELPTVGRWPGNK